VTFIDSEVEQAMQPRSAASSIGVAEVTHDLIRDQLSEYLDNSLPEDDRARVDEHLRHCGDCRAYRNTLRATSQAVSDLPREKAPDSIKQRLLQVPEA
jgi:anti-sigma factor RsiW